jgi:hypothetical protein
VIVTTAWTQTVSPTEKMDGTVVQSAARHWVVAPWTEAAGEMEPVRDLGPPTAGGAVGLAAGCCGSASCGARPDRDLGEAVLEAESDPAFARARGESVGSGDASDELEREERVESGEVAGADLVLAREDVALLTTLA